MIVGLCGTHGTGKSTILQGVKEQYSVNEAQLSRAAQKALGWDKLSRAEESVDNMWLLQDAIQTAMYDRDRQALTDSGVTGITLVERTPADVWAYTLMWCERLNIDWRYDSRAMNYKGRCIMMAQNYSKFLFVPQTEAVPFVAEPNRADLKGRQFVNDAIYAFLWDGVYPFHQFVETGKHERIHEALAHMLLAKTSRKDHL